MTGMETATLAVLTTALFATIGLLATALFQTRNQFDVIRNELTEIIERLSAMEVRFAAVEAHS